MSCICVFCILYVFCQKSHLAYFNNRFKVSINLDQCFQCFRIMLSLGFFWPQKNSARISSQCLIWPQPSGTWKRWPVGPVAVATPPSDRFPVTRFACFRHCKVENRFFWRFSDRALCVCLTFLTYFMCFWVPFLDPFPIVFPTVFFSAFFSAHCKAPSDRVISMLPLLEGSTFIVVSSHAKIGKLEKKDDLAFHKYVHVFLNTFFFNSKSIFIKSKCFRCGSFHRVSYFDDLHLLRALIRDFLCQEGRHLLTTWNHWNRGTDHR